MRETAPSVSYFTSTILSGEILWLTGSTPPHIGADFRAMAVALLAKYCPIPAWERWHVTMSTRCLAAEIPRATPSSSAPTIIRFWRRWSVESRAGRRARISLGRTAIQELGKPASGDLTERRWTDSVKSSKLSRMETTTQYRFEDIESELIDGTPRKFRAKYPGTCVSCGHKFRPPAEIVYKFSFGLTCWECVQTVRSTAYAWIDDIV